MRVTVSTILERLGRPGLAAALLVGAGMSVEAGIPMAKKDLPQIKSVVTQIAEHLFFRENKRLPVSPEELELWLRGKGILQHEETRYSDALQLIAKDNEGRQRYLEQFFSGRKPLDFHEMIARFVSRGFFRSIFTTNFDPLLERALLFAGLDVAVAADPEVVRKLAATSAPVVYKVHGDYLLTNHKHTVEETRALAEAMKARLVESLQERSILVIGHSGSDHSIMTALQEGLVHSDSTEVLWVLYGNEVPSPLLRDLERQFERRVVIASTTGYREFWETAGKRILDRAPLVRNDPRILGSYFVGRTEVTVLRGDICEVGAEAIVSSDDRFFSQGGGVSEAIARNAGQALERDLAQFAPQLPVPVGEVVATGPGLLADRGVRYILHAAITPDPGRPATVEAARICTLRIMQEAEARSVHTLAVPAIGAGHGGLLPQDVAEAVVGGVLEHLHAGSTLKQVIFVIYTNEAVEAFKSGQMDQIARQQEQDLRDALSRLPTELSELGEAVLSQQGWGVGSQAASMAANTWLREMVALGGAIAEEAIRYCHARWHTYLCHLLARQQTEPVPKDDLAYWTRQVQALEVTYAAVFR